MSPRRRGDPPNPAQALRHDPQLLVLGPATTPAHLNYLKMFDYRSGRMDSHKVCPLLTSPPKQGGPRRRSTFSHVPGGKLREVALMLKAIHAQEDLPAAQRKAGEVVARLRDMRLGKAAELVETAVPETLAYYAFPEEHWRRVRTNNPLERIMSARTLMRRLNRNQFGLQLEFNFQRIRDEHQIILTHLRIDRQKY